MYVERYVGVPQIVNYQPATFIEDITDDGDNMPDPDLTAILIPHIHPGRDRYEVQPEALRDVIVLTHMVSLAIAERVISCILDGQHEKYHRKTLLKKILEEFKQTETLLVNKLNEAKRRLAGKWKISLNGEKIRAKASVLFLAFITNGRNGV